MNGEKKIKRLGRSVASLYLRGERTVKLKRNSANNMLTLELALERMKLKREGHKHLGGGHYK